MVLDLSLRLDTQYSEREAFAIKSNRLIVCLMEIGVVFNYMGCQKYIPFLNTESRRRRVVIYIIVLYILLIAVAIRGALLEMLI